MPITVARKKSAWKEIQSRTKIKKRTKLALGVLALIAGLLIASWAIRFTQSLFSPYIWNGQFNINLLVRNPRIFLLSYNPKEEKITILNIPDELFLDVPFGFGKWQLRSIYELGQSQKQIGGDRLLADTLTNFLAIPIDGFLDFSALQDQKSATEVVEFLRKNPFSGLNFLSALKTDLTIWELLRLKLGMGRVRFDKVKELNLDKLSVLDRENLPDGTPVYTTDPVKLDSVLSDFADPAITFEHKTIAVLNTTGQPQLAQKVARLITNLGGNVIITTNASQKLQKTLIQGEQSLTLRRLKQIFRLSDKINSSDENIISSRAQINVLLGEDRL